jgi:polyphenol oxidase
MAVVVGALGARVRGAFADRADGVSAPPYDRGNLADHVGDDPVHVEANRALLAAALGLGLADVVAMAPVHSDGVAVVDRGTRGPVADVDALVTSTPGLALLTLAADCVPVVLADDTAGVVAVVHSGWKGVVVDVVGATLDRMASLGASAATTRAVVGPAICGACYAVPQERFDEVVAAAPAAAARARDGQPGLDLRAAVLARLAAAGVEASTNGGCTAESDTLFSYRRDHVTGRHGGIVALLAGEPT